LYTMSVDNKADCKAQSMSRNDIIIKYA